MSALQVDQRPARIGMNVDSTAGGDAHLLDMLQQAIQEREALRQELEASKEELERRKAKEGMLRQVLRHRRTKEKALRQVLRKPMKDAHHDTAKVLVANLLLDAKAPTEEPEIMGHSYRQMCLQVEYDDLPKLAKRYGMTESSLERYLLRLDLAHVCARKFHKRDTYPNGKPAPYAVTESTTLYLPGFDRLADCLPHALPTTKQMDSQRRKADDTRDWARKGKELYCPECHQQGLEGRCTHCGHVIQPEEGKLSANVDSTASCVVLDVDSTAREVSMSNDGTATATDGIKTPPDAPSAVQTWLLKWIGSDPTIGQQLNEEEPRKYVSLGEIVPDLDAYLTGQIVYSSRPRQSNGKTWLIVGDCDKTGHDLPKQAVGELARAGVASLYFQRGHGGRLVIFFDSPVDADAALAYLLPLCPALAGVSEWFPCRNGKVNRQGSNLGWPLTRVQGNGKAAKVVSCPLYAMTPAGELFESPGWLEGDEAQDVILQALATCTNPATLIPESVPGSHSPAPRGGFDALKSPRKQATRKQSSSDGGSIVREAIRDFNERNTPEGLGLPTEGYFKVRNERTPSTCWDKDYSGYMATDFGTGEKLDLFEVNVRLKGLNRRAEIARVCREYRVAHLEPAPKASKPVSVPTPHDALEPEAEPFLAAMLEATMEAPSAPSLYDGWQRSDIYHFRRCVALWRAGDFQAAYDAANLMTDSARGERERQKRAIQKDIDAAQVALHGDAIAADLIAGLARQESGYMRSRQVAAD